MFDYLYKCIRELPPTGPAGFEGFAKALLEAFAPDLGIRFIAKAGYQGGVDASSAGFRNTWAGLQCKHYERASSPRPEELLGQLTNAVGDSNYQLDLWLLVTTGEIGSTAATKVQHAAVSFGVAAEVIDWQCSGLPDLAVLCAAVPDTLIRELHERVPSCDESQIGADLEDIKARAEFDSIQERLRQRLSAANIGYSQARIASEIWLEQSISSSRNSMARFRQALCPGDREYSAFVPRSPIFEALNNWLDRLPNGPRIALLSGKEGVGKSWAAVSWWRTRSERPLTLLASSNLPLEARSPIKLISTLLAEQQDQFSLDFWQRAVRRWMARPASSKPLFLILFDGLNERPVDNWPSRLAMLEEVTVRGHVAAVVTCRDGFWRRRVAPWINPDCYTRINVPVLSTPELSELLAESGIEITDLRDDVVDFLRTPRVFKAAVGQLAVLRSAGDLSVERLMVLDTRHRLTSKLGLGLTEAEFNLTVANAAKELLSHGPTLPRTRLRELAEGNQIDPSADLAFDVEEIAAGQLLVPTDPQETAFTLNRGLVTSAIGLILAVEVRATAQEDPGAIRQKINELSDTYLNFDRAASVFHAAVSCACVWPGYPVEGLEELLSSWLSLRNRPESQLGEFVAYFTSGPYAYLNVAERISLERTHYPEAERWMSEAIASAFASSQDVQSIQERLNGWLSLWHPAWRPFLGRATREEVEEQCEKINQRAKFATAEEARLIDARLTRGDNADCPYLSRLAFLVIAKVPRKPFIPGIAAWALARVLMKLPVDTEWASWTLRLNPLDFQAAETALRVEAEQLDAMDGPMAKETARFLRLVSGSEIAMGDQNYQVREWRTYPLKQLALESVDPARARPSLEESLDRLQQIEPDQVHAAMGRTKEELLLEDIEVILSAFHPEPLAEFFRSVLRTAPTRDFVGVRQLAIHGVEYGQLVGEREFAALDRAWRRLIGGAFSVNQNDLWFAESQLMLSLLLRERADDQLTRLSERPKDAMQLLRFEPLMRTMLAGRCRNLLAGLAENQPFRVARSTLWVLSTQTFKLGPRARTALASYLTHQDKTTRMLALRIACNCEDQELLAQVFKSGWSYQSNEPDDPLDIEGTRALALYRHDAAYLHVRGRVHPALLGWVARTVGTPNAINEYAEDLHAIWQCAVATNRRRHGLRSPPEIATDESLERQIGPAKAVIRANQAIGPPAGHTVAHDRNNYAAGPEEGVVKSSKSPESPIALFKDVGNRARKLLGFELQSYCLAEVASARPDLVEAWIGALSEEDADSLLAELGVFYRGLADALKGEAPEISMKIFQLLRKRGSPFASPVIRPLMVDALTQSEFRLPRSYKSDQMWESRLQSAITDEEIFQLALAAQEAGQDLWLSDVIRRNCSAENLSERARALTLVGFLDDTDDLRHLQANLRDNRGFLLQVAETASKRLQRNKRARYWFAEFVRRSSEEESWAALRLALRCVDRRYYLWKETLLEGLSNRHRGRRRVLSAMKDAIRSHVERNEREHTRQLRVLLFGEPIVEQLWPWSAEE